jgi:hypothetical protein
MSQRVEWTRGVATLVLASLGALAVAPAARAVDGVIEISQERILAGGVTPGDAPGYPLTIAAPGSYRFTGHLTPVGVAGAAPSIEIVAPARDVAIDLNGFSLDGGGSCTAGATGASCALSGLPNGIVSSTGAQLSIRNGAIRGLRAAIVISSAAAVTLEDLLLTEHTNSGVFVEDGIPATIRRVVASVIAGRGIDAVSAAVIDCIADHCQQTGIRAFEVSGSRASANTSAGITLSAGGLATNVTARGNSIGVQALAGSSVVSSVLRDNTSVGISAAADATYAGCTLTGNNGGGNLTQVSGGTALGANFCGTDTTCP